MSKISMIVPYLKGPDYLEDCIESLQNQNISDYEVLLVNDRDGDDIPERIKDHPNVRVIELEEEYDFEEFRREFRRRTRSKERHTRLNYHMPINGELENKLKPYGVAAARNQGVKYATGDYIYFLDADDYLLDGSLGRLLDLAEKKKAVVTTGNRVNGWFRYKSYDETEIIPDTGFQGIGEVGDEEIQELVKNRFTVQNLLIRKDFYDSLELSFDEYNYNVADMPVVATLLKEAKGNMWYDGDAVYVWKTRNDIVFLPQISQKKNPYRRREYYESYEKTIQILEGDTSGMTEALHQSLCDFFIAEFGRRLEGDYLVHLSDLLREMDKKEMERCIADYEFWDKKAIRCLYRGKYTAAAKCRSLAFLFRKKKGILGNPIQRYRLLKKQIFRRMSLKEDWVFVESFFGKSYSDSPKYLYEYMLEHYPGKYKYILCVNEKTKDMKGNPICCKLNSLKYVYYSSRAKYLILNVRQPAWFFKRPGQVFLETWHGTPLKKLAFDLDDIHAASQDHKRMFYRQTREWDYLISANPFSTEVFQSAFCFPEEKILEVGYPRNDILYSDQKDKIAEEVRNEFQIPADKKVILYAPTWRDDQFYEKGKYKFTLAMDLDLMREQLGDEYVILLRTHYHIADILDLSDYEGFVYNGSQYNDISRLYLASDLCITDYSSVFFDYANLRRPLIFFAYDLDDYAGEIRGMYFDMVKEVPGPVVKTNEEVVECVKNLPQIEKEYKEKYDKFYDKFCSVDDGHASQRTIEHIFGRN